MWDVMSSSAQLSKGGPFSGDSWVEPGLSWCCRNSWKSPSRCKVGPRAQEEHVRWMESAAGGNKNLWRRWKYFVRNFSSLGGTVTESNSLQKWLCLSKQKGVKEFIQEWRVMKEHRNLGGGTERWWFSRPSILICREKMTQTYLKICNGYSLFSQHYLKKFQSNAPFCAKWKVSEKLETAMEMLRVFCRNPEWKEEVLHEIGTFLIWCYELDMYS